MRMADGHGFPFFARTAQGQFELLAHRANLRDVIEKRNIAKRRGNARSLSRFVGHSRRRCAAVNVKEMMVAQHRHQLLHQSRIGSGFRALMIVDAHSAGNVRQKLTHEF